MNYLIGKDPSKWATNVPTYPRVAYRGVWKGIDVAFYGNQHQVEYDYRLAPNADPGQIAVRLSGARRLRLDTSGNLVVGLRGGSVRELAPRAYQTIGGSRRPVASRYVIRSGNRVGVRLGGYDRRLPLVIDPTLSYSTYLGGSGFDLGNEIAVDSAGNAYVTGRTDSTNFPTTPGAPQTTSGGDGDAFVAKLNPTGTALSYSTYLGGDRGSDSGDGIAVDSAGNAYVTGSTNLTLYVVGGANNSLNFPTTPGAFQTTSGGIDDPMTSGFGDAFVTKVNPTGTALSYSTYLGGGGDDRGNEIAVDSAGNAYVTGSTQSKSFPTSPGAFRATRSGAWRSSTRRARRCRTRPTSPATRFTRAAGSRWTRPATPT